MTNQQYVEKKLKEIEKNRAKAIKIYERKWLEDVYKSKIYKECSVYNSEYDRFEKYL